MLVSAKAYLLMNCAADMVRQHGIHGFEHMQNVRMVATGNRLDRAWSVIGQLPDELGGGAAAVASNCGG